MGEGLGTEKQKIVFKKQPQIEAVLLRNTHCLPTP
jgi:hypothetical protein